jgi:hypothetical protein
MKSYKGDQMKKLFVIILTIQSLSSIAGSIINRKTSEEIDVQIHEDAEVIQVKTENKFKEIPLSWFEPSLYSPTVIRTLMPETVTTITNYDGVCGSGSQWSDLTSKQRLSRVAEVLFITPVAAVFDLATMPSRLYKDGRYTADIKTIMKAVEINKRVKVSNRKFKRLQSQLRVGKE